MISDGQLNSIAVSLGVASMVLITAFHLITRNTEALREEK